MKKHLLLVVVALMTTVSVLAQEGYDDTKHEIAISYGAGANSDIIDGFENLGIATVGATTDNDSYFGSLSVEYFYHLKPWLGVGGIVAYGQMTEDLYLTGKKNGKDGDIKNNYVTLMPAAKFDWLRKKHFGLYSKLAIGATLRSEKIDYINASYKDFSDSEIHVNWQATLLGVEFGAPKFRGFVEFGTGEQGILLAGLRYKF